MTKSVPIKDLSLEDIAQMLGAEVDELGEKCIELIKSFDFRYQILNAEAEHDFILDVFKKINNDTQIIGSPERTEVWMNGWQENLDSFLNNRDKSSIVPKFIRPNNVIRLNGKFCNTVNPYFERDFAKVIQTHLYHKHIDSTIDEVHEFGCGSGFNLINLSEIRPEINLYGSDFVESSVNLIKELAIHYDLNLKSEQFNMLQPDYNYKIGQNSCVFTHGSIEQLASKFENFVNFLIYKKPKVCFHIEPVCEVYNLDSLFDYSQYMFHKKRGYTSGLLPYLQEKEKLGIIKDVSFKRLYFGSKFMEGYTVISWSSV